MNEREGFIAGQWFAAGATFVGLIWIFAADWPGTIRLLTSAWLYEVIGFIVVIQFVAFLLTSRQRVARRGLIDSVVSGRSDWGRVWNRLPKNPPD